MNESGKKKIQERAKEFNKETYSQIKFEVRKELNFNELLKQGAKLHGISRAQYIMFALSKQLSEDGIEFDIDSATKYNVTATKKGIKF